MDILINQLGSVISVGRTLRPAKVLEFSFDKRTILKSVYLLAFIVGLYFVVLYKTFVLTNIETSPLIWFYTSVVSTFLISRFLISFFYDDSHKWNLKGKKYPGVTFIIACKNEEDSISKTIDACLASNYQGPMECIAVNDGSTDNTLLEMRESQKKHAEKLGVLSFEKNRGKREAMAEGALMAKYEIIVYVDSDSFVDKNGVAHLVEHFMADKKVGAVAGNSLVANSNKNMLTKMQSARYGISFDVLKSCESVYGAVTCCPGCFSGYRKEAILEVMEKWRYQKFLGTQSTFGDDRSLTNFILRRWKVVYCRKARAYTIAPEHYKKFFKQQFRWKKSWIREGFNAGRIMWKKHPIASVSYYANLIIPIFAPLIAFNALFIDSIQASIFPLTYIFGLFGMSFLFGLYYQTITINRYWLYIVPFTVIHSFVLIWQMPLAILKVRDTKWGTR